MKYCGVLCCWYGVLRLRVQRSLLCTRGCRPLYKCSRKSCAKSHPPSLPITRRSQSYAGPGLPLHSRYWTMPTLIQVMFLLHARHTTYQIVFCGERSESNARLQAADGPIPIHPWSFSSEAFDTAVYEMECHRVNIRDSKLIKSRMTKLCLNRTTVWPLSHAIDCSRGGRRKGVSCNLLCAHNPKITILVT